MLLYCVLFCNTQIDGRFTKTPEYEHDSHAYKGGDGQKPFPGTQHAAKAGTVCLWHGWTPHQASANANVKVCKLLESLSELGGRMISIAFPSVRTAAFSSRSLCISLGSGHRRLSILPLRCLFRHPSVIHAAEPRVTWPRPKRTFTHTHSHGDGNLSPIVWSQDTPRLCVISRWNDKRFTVPPIKFGYTPARPFFCPCGFAPSFVFRVHACLSCPCLFFLAVPRAVALSFTRGIQDAVVIAASARRSRAGGTASTTRRADTRLGTCRRTCSETGGQTSAGAVMRGCDQPSGST